MCNIAGYVGEKLAAPILIEMLRKQEGLDCGFYTGIATLHEGKIYYAKLAGDLDRLLEMTEAANLPGNIGIIHGRTPGDAGDEFSHPFVCEMDGEIKTAFVLNGDGGAFVSRREGYGVLAESLLEKGYDMKSRVSSTGVGVKLSDQTRVHTCDVLCQVISRNILEGTDTVNAMADAYYEMPLECVGLLLSLNEPDAITWCETNFPMHVGFADHGAYLATTPLAFPEDAGEPRLLPPLSSGLIRKDEFTCQRFQKLSGNLAPLNYQVSARSYEELCSFLKVGRKTIPNMTSMGMKWFAPSDYKYGQMRAAMYEIIDDLNRQGKLKFEKEYVPGFFEGTKAPVLYMTYIE